MPEQVLYAEKLCAGYRKNVIVDGISFCAESGKILTLIGPNGAGKSTVLKTIAAQLPALGGKLMLCGQEMQKLSPHETAKRLSVMLTGRLTAERMTCTDVVGTGRYPYTGRLGILSAKDREIVRAALELTGAAALADRDFLQISDGQRQTVMLARALAQEPAVLVLDEPTSFLDITHKLHILSLLRRLAREKNISVVQSLHELDLAQKFSDRILCIEKGRAVCTGTPEEVFAGDTVARVYGLENGSYDPLYGSAEPAAVTGEPRVFVIAGGGLGIPVYRQLQRAGIPFAAGVIPENDLDHPVAKALAAAVVTGAAFAPVGEAEIQQALAVMERCEKVICCTPVFGAVNRKNEELRRQAAAAGKLTEAEELIKGSR